MWKCDRCARLLLPGAFVCPFCASHSVAALGMAIVGPLVLSACYGGPPCTDTPVDADADQFQTALCDTASPVEDCDDSNPDVHPGAEEICDDGIDNNCDGVQAETDAAEVCNGVDDDCDEQIDEDLDCDSAGTTSAR